ncbi:hypothetical protein Esi_0011_0211 [Ectocarpus siliculosus]|uniref:Uncharacterized protein n=1 Tax=Ectocarpus siliculosus TaxID=2880 RepID=D8LCT0_ECTSI|nr:hypothetical protein Esi_0011_0211 [Ectocarpus siliculosus]|eukprot:CBN79593.1 hypothetical protein Esi_0011_0211 [Ectocarpus siliculosus]
MFIKIDSGDSSECLVGCTLLALDPFDTDLLVEWDDRSTCDDSAGCEVNTGDTLARWTGCGSFDASRCLWAASSGEDGSDDCTCSVCGSVNSYGSSYMSDYPTWTRIACYIADMEAIGFDASVCVAAVVDDGVMACVDEAYEIPTFEQFSCPSTYLTLATSSNCEFDGSLREAEEMFATIGTSAESDDVIGYDDDEDDYAVDDEMEGCFARFQAHSVCERFRTHERLFAPNAAGHHPILIEKPFSRIEEYTE